MTNKFKDSAKVWMQYGAFKTRSGDLDGMRRLLPRALAVVPKRKRTLCACVWEGPQPRSYWYGE